MFCARDRYYSSFTGGFSNMVSFLDWNTGSSTALPLHPLSRTPILDSLQTFVWPCCAWCSLLCPALAAPRPWPRAPGIASLASELFHQHRLLLCCLTLAAIPRLAWGTGLGHCLPWPCPAVLPCLTAPLGSSSSSSLTYSLNPAHLYKPSEVWGVWLSDVPQRLNS